MNKNMVGVVIQRTLLSIGTSTSETVEKILKEEYSCTFSDCFEHPEYINRILKDFYGNAHTEIINSIKKELHDWMNDKSISDFVVKIASK